MKKQLIFCLVGIGLSSFSFAQISEGGIPTSFALLQLDEKGPYAAEYQVQQLLAPDMDLVFAEDLEADGKGKPYRVGINIPVSFSINNSGTWIELPNGDKIWRLGIRIPAAQALTLYFGAPVQIPLGGKLHAYNEKHSQYVGAYTSATPTFQAMEMIEGELLTLEYYMPAGSSELPIIEISEIAYYYRGIESRIASFRDGDEISQDRAHGSCHVDAVCSESAGFTDQRSSTVLYSFVDGGTFFCSASVINNTAADCTPYVLSANHCGEPTASSDITNHIWYFNYERPTCEPGNTAAYSGALSQTMSGGIFRASSSLGIHPAGNSFQMDGADFVLIRLTSAIPAPYNAFYAGWSRSTTPATSGICYHHPSGDDKKISTYSSPLILSTYNAGWTDAHWEVTWVATANGHGVTEPGSSGSAIYDQNGRIVGHLSGGLSYCVSPTDPDLYGKFELAWASDGTTNDSQLEPWLDPGNTNAMTLNGTFFPCTPTIPTADFVADQTTVAPATAIDFTDLSLGSPDTWAWVIAPAVGWAFSGGTNASFQNPEITFNTSGLYTITLTSTNLQGSDAEIKTDYIEVTSTGPGPCAATGTVCDEYISNVTLGTINNSTVCTNYASYVSSTDVLIGYDYDISLFLGQAYNNDELGAWIDWNEDGDFGDANETISYTLITLATSFPVITNFTVPTGTALGPKTLRVRVSYSLDAPISPCGTSAAGEVEDYVVNVTSDAGSSFENKELGTVSIYPNPTSGDLTVDLTKLNTDVESIQLIDITGRIISTVTTTNNTIVFNLTSEAAGVYFIKINTSEGLMTKKVIRY